MDSSLGVNAADLRFVSARFTSTGYQWLDKRRNVGWANKKTKSALSDQVAILDIIAIGFNTVW